MLSEKLRHLACHLEHRQALTESERALLAEVVDRLGELEDEEWDPEDARQAAYRAEGGRDPAGPSEHWQPARHWDEP